MKKISVIDSHTGGEPTRLIIAGGPDLGDGTIAERSARFGAEHSKLISAVIGEPRASDVFVGGLICEPSDEKYSTGIIFYDADGVLRMCGHGTIGTLVSLYHLGKIEPGSHLIETEVGTVEAMLLDRNTVQFKNVPSWRSKKDATVEVPGFGQIVGDVAWGGNWFFLVKHCPIDLHVSNEAALIEFGSLIRDQLRTDGIAGDDGDAIRHIEIHGPSETANIDARNFVLCPGGAYDRSPCGTGTSAKVACLAADGLLKPGDVWRQESIVGSVFEASFERDGDDIIPMIKGTAYITGELELLLDPADPFCYGISSAQKTTS